MSASTATTGTLEKFAPPKVTKGTWQAGISSRGIAAWIAGFVITLFYVALYWFPEWLGLNKDSPPTGIIALFNPLSLVLSGKPASQWFVYGTLYTLAILVFGVRFMVKHRHNRYQQVRTLSVMFFQLGFAFLIPEILAKLNPDTPYFGTDIKNMWPLDYDFFYDWHIKNSLKGGALGKGMLLWGVALIVIISPTLTYFFGKRWYCSWVCGCGGLAETAGDSFRHLSDKSTRAWKLERWSIHTVLLLSVWMTLAVLYTFFSRRKGEGDWLSQGDFIGITLVILGLVAAFFLFGKRGISSMGRTRPVRHRGGGLGDSGRGRLQPLHRRPRPHVCQQL